MSREKLIGTWKLISLELRSFDGNVTYPFDKYAVGYIKYTHDGYMSVDFMKAERLKFSSGDILKGTSEEMTSALELFQFYCGKYEVIDKTVIHHINVSSFPNWSGVDQERFFEFEGNRLK